MTGEDNKPEYTMDRVLLDLRGIHNSLLRLMNKTQTFVDDNQAPEVIITDLGKLENRLADVLTLAEDWRELADLNGIDIKKTSPPIG